MLSAAAAHAFYVLAPFLLLIPGSQCHADADAAVAAGGGPKFVEILLVNCKTAAADSTAAAGSGSASAAANSGSGLHTVLSVIHSIS